MNYENKNSNYIINNHRLLPLFRKQSVIRQYVEKKDVILDKGNEDDETKHARNPVYIPLNCYYKQGYIYLNTFTDLGEIFITITNLETGEWWEYVNISNSELICIPTSSAIGNYMVKIVMENDGSYFGYFTL